MASNGGEQQGVDLSTAGIHGYDESFLLDAGLIVDGGGINYASLSKLSCAMGNALTQSIASSAWAPWLTGDDIFDVSGQGVGQNSSTNLTMGSPNGGDTVSW